MKQQCPPEVSKSCYRDSSGLPPPAVRFGGSREEDERRRTRISDAWLTQRGRRVCIPLFLGPVHLNSSPRRRPQSTLAPLSHLCLRPALPLQGDRRVHRRHHAHVRVRHHRCHPCRQAGLRQTTMGRVKPSESKCPSPGNTCSGPDSHLHTTASVLHILSKTGMNHPGSMRERARSALLPTPTP